jgi:rhodanese-related sulfurtransferase
MNIVPFLIHNWMLVVIAIVSGGLLLWFSLEGGGRGGVRPDAAVQMINREKAVVVDVSEAEEFAAGHVAGSRNVPLGQFQDRLPQVVKNKQVPLILVCATGARAQRALGTAKSLGYDKAVVLGGGLKAWKDANLPVEKA